ncbi:energy-coupling factor ABC transporter ATP-binding protein [Candidatus Bipolaricaulota sp. J31]
MRAILTARDLHFSYGRHPVLRGVDLEVRRGEVLAVVGPNGAGKTTLFRLLTFYLRPQRGTVVYYLDGCPTPVREARRRIAAVLQEPVLFSTDVFGNVAYGLLLRASLGERMRARLGRSLRHLGVPLAPSAIEARVSEILEMVGLGGFERRRASALSRGEAQRVALARALVLEPKVLFLDEPTASLDPESAAVVEETIRRLGEEGRTVLFTTHDPAQARRLANRIVRLAGGRIVEEEELTRKEAVPPPPSPPWG